MLLALAPIYPSATAVQWSGRQIRDDAQTGGDDATYYER
jgi:hypothetical protein